MRIRSLSVSEVNGYINKIMKSDPLLGMISIHGEISNFKHHSSGHAYFSLKDEKSRIPCVMFKHDMNALEQIPKEGDRVVAKGSISVYERDGRYQLYVKSMTLDGIGDLHKKFELLKKELDDKGYFDKSRKQPLPVYPKKIGVVTSPTGAAVRDMISVITRRNPLVDILVIPARVQGLESKEEIAMGIEILNERDDIDLIITGRGGGSIEELWAFNERLVAESIFRSKIPVISAVGHETDFTIADFVADMRAPTPSAAGELAVKSMEEMELDLKNLYNRMISATRRKIDYQKNEVLKRSPLKKYNEIYFRLKNYYQEIDNSFIKLKNDTLNKIKDEKQFLEKLGLRLNSFNPLSILEKGYSVVRDDKRNVKMKITDFKENERLEIITSDGSVNVDIDNLETGVNYFEKK